MVRKAFFLALLVAGLLIPAWGARLAAADSPPEWITFTPVCEVQYVTPDGTYHIITDVGQLDARYQEEKGFWDQIRLDKRVIPVLLVQIQGC